VEVIWHDFDARCERVVISQVDGFGVRPRFLVRDKEDWIQGHHSRGRFYAEDELELISAHYTGGTFLDVGANVGNHSIFAATALDAKRVIACEPNPTAATILLCNIALNQLSEVVQHVSVGLSDKASTAVAQEKVSNLGATRLIEGEGPLQVNRGDELFADEIIGFLKVDVEGAEVGVLNGLQSTIRRCKPPMLVEVDDANRPWFQLFYQALDYELVETLKPYKGQANLLVLPRG
jgi:FkbM family methyltransferase